MSYDLVNDRYNQARLFLYSLLIWAFIFIVIEKKVNFKSISKPLSNDIKNRLVSIIHGLMAFWGSVYLLTCIHIIVIEDYYTPLGDLNLD